MKNQHQQRPFTPIANHFRQTTLMLLSLALLTSMGCNMAADRANVRGTGFFQSGQYAQAINEFQTALNRNPGNSNALYNLGSTLFAMGKQQKNRQWLDQAEQLFRQSITSNQSPQAHRSLAALLIETGREKSAFDLINGWKQQNPGLADPSIELARLYQEYGDNRRAIDLLTDALRVDTNNVRALAAMGYLRELQGEKSLALQNYLRVLQTDNQQNAVIERVAWLQNELQRGVSAAQLPNAASNNSTPNNTYQSAIRIGQTPNQSTQPNSNSYVATPNFGPGLVAVNRTQATGFGPISNGVNSSAGPARYGSIDPYLAR